MPSWASSTGVNMKRNMTKTGHSGIRKVDGGFSVRVRLTDPRTGRMVERERVFVGIGVKEAKSRREELRQEILAGTPVAVERTTLTDYARSWYRQRLPGWKVSTRARYLVALEQHVLPFLGARVVHDIRRTDVLDWRARMSQRRTVGGVPVKSKTVNSWTRLLLELLKDAVVDLELEHDPTIRIKALPERDSHLDDPNYLEAEEVPGFLEAMKKLFYRFYPMVAVGFFTGMRWGELSALQWGDIDENRGRVTVSKSHYKGVVATTKTDTVRTVPLHPLLLAIFDEQRVLVLKSGRRVGPRNLVFPSRKGTCMKPSTLARPIREVLQEAGIERRLTPHGMRRTFNNLMRQVVSDGVLVRSMTGHMDERMTGHYSVVGMPEKQHALQRVFVRIGMAVDEGAAAKSPADPPEGVREQSIGDEVGDRVGDRPAEA